uniref:Uncharacterized protein n=1 Tax=Oryzias latipes TaxID=8090 RepID=A0A3P9JC30_ORYLA
MLSVCRDRLPSVDLEMSNALLPATSSTPLEERQPLETSNAMVRTDDITELPAEPLLRSCVSTASMKVKNMKKLTFPRGHFPRLAECAHFHYETVDFGNVQVSSDSIQQRLTVFLGLGLWLKFSSGFVGLIQKCLTAESILFSLTIS